MRLNFFILLALFVFISNYGFSNSVISYKSVLVYQKDQNIFDEDRLKELRTNEDYDYTENKVSDNWWNEFKEWLWIKLQKLLGDDVGTDSILFKILKLLPYIIPAIAVVIIVWYIIKTNPGSQVMRQHNKSKVILTEEEELLMERDLDRLADEAIANKELRVAVRYLYLSCIKRLDMKRIIRYANEKTNYEYVKEIQFVEVAKQFKNLTLAYEQIWYGQMVFDQAYFQKYKSKIEKFHSLLDQKQYAKA